FQEVLNYSIIGRAQKKNLVKIKIHNLREWATDKHKSVDDKPFGGGAGMVMKVEIIDRALQSFKSGYKILLTPQGKTFNQQSAQKLAKFNHLILICGHYEGFDERISELVDEEISIGDYVLTGGEIPAMVMTDAIVRLLPGVIEAESLAEESFNPPAGGLECPQYTRPEEYKKMKVPAVLLSGNHEKIKQWRQEEAKKRTKERRPDLLK
ncbi:tRNA (guanosine(37)-N1)-methyltransferase TrmD, partial [Microgenomates group bacterium]|nr:tRNA (guanosine(37)-N1)-methyltransferase TrmD [Microgenomates group bacterium]